MKRKSENAAGEISVGTHWRAILHEVIFEADTQTGKAFDIILILCILISVLTVMLDSIDQLRFSYGRLLYTIEWIFTLLFTVEYILRAPRCLEWVTS